MSRIIDISEHQGLFNWDLFQQAFNAGEVDGVIIRAGYGTATGMQRDAQLTRNRQEAINRGIPHGFYGFAYPSRSGGAVQGRGMAAILGSLKAGESIWLDMEDEPTYGRRIVASDVAWSDAFCDAIESLLGPKCGVYMNSDLLARLDWSVHVRADRGLWLANYGANNGQPGTKPASGEWPFIALWQFTSKANIRGIYPLDNNVFDGDRAAFLKYGLQGSAPAPVPETPKPSDPAPVAGNSTSYVLAKDTPGYVNSGDAAARKNSNSTAKAGTYYVFNQASGMVNITKTPGVPGYWINPNENTVAATPASPSANYTIAKSTRGYYSANDAKTRTNPRNTVAAGRYFVYNTYAGMVNVTTKQGVPGSWINPTDANGAEAVNPGSQAVYITVPGGATNGKLAAQYGSTVDQIVAWNKAKYPSVTRDYLQAGWTGYRVR